MARVIEACRSESVALDDSDLREHAIGLAHDVGTAAFRRLPVTQKRAANAMFRSVARSMTDETMSRVRHELLREVSRAMRLPPLQREIYLKRALRRLGVAGDDKHVFSTVTRTQAAIANAAATWIETRGDPKLWGYELCAKADRRTRPSHWAMNGVRYPKEHTFWQKYFPPNGWNCRCRPKPIYRGDQRARTRPFVGTPDVDPGFRFNPGRVMAGVY